MDITLLIFLSSGLFLGWSLGANDAANVFGTAVGSRMISFTTAALICTVFVILGATISGAGAAHGLGKLGALNALPGAFMAAFSAALTVFWMTKLGLPVSTTQAVVGAIIGWNLFSGSITDIGVLTKIIATWVACPLLGAAFGALLYSVTTRVIQWSDIHLLRLDSYVRLALIFAGAFGAYSLGANNIGNVMGVFISSSPFTDVRIFDAFTFTSIQQLFLMGAIAIGVGVITYSKRVMMTVGNSLMPLSPVAAWVVVIAHSVVLFLFSSIALEHFLASNGLPTIPLIPVSSSQAVVGAVIGIGLLKGGKGIKWTVLGNISSGWVTTPIISAIICFVMLFFLQNVFNQKVYEEVYFELSDQEIAHLEQSGIDTGSLHALKDKKIAKAVKFRELLRKHTDLSDADLGVVIETAEIYPIYIDEDKASHADKNYLGEARFQALQAIIGETFNYKWQLYDALSKLSKDWQLKPKTKLNKAYNKQLKSRLGYLHNTFRLGEDGINNSKQFEG
ncbi:MAG: inorganic phosphate transporter [Proteobacteria bacterium]|nr:MAG: inorganic phosphate transporter [Pseudomonadota bacterium]PIE40098.1 MAG: inorganic phosphate transporter [Gammaproteobacteria bacterium]